MSPAPNLAAARAIQRAAAHRFAVTSVDRQSGNRYRFTYVDGEAARRFAATLAADLPASTVTMEERIDPDPADVDYRRRMRDGR